VEKEVKQMKTNSTTPMIRPTPSQIDAAAKAWHGEKERETFHDDILYFRYNWRHLPGLRSYVERECGKEQTS
jgi:hypothetical protein